MSGLRRVKLLIPAFSSRRCDGCATGATPSTATCAELQLELPDARRTPIRDDRARGSRAGVAHPRSAAEHVEHVRRLRPGQLTTSSPRSLSASQQLGRRHLRHISTLGGGGRLGALAATIGFCVSGIGAGALCVATGVVTRRASSSPDQRGAGQARAQPRRARSADRTPQAHLPATVRFAEAKRNRDADARRRAPRPAPATPKRPPASVDPSQGTGRPPTSPPRSPSLVELGPRVLPRAAVTTIQSPAYAPATGGGEFTP